MQVKVNALELASREYFSIRHESIGEYQQNEAVNILWLRLGAAGLRVALLIPPMGHCWGMQFSHARALAAWVEDIVVSPLTERVFREGFDGLGIDPADIPETLAGCSFFGESREFTIGTREPDVPRAWFRTVIVPDSEQAFEDFLCRVRMHIEQLGLFFLLPAPGVDQARVLAWSESVDENLELLFGKEHVRSKYTDMSTARCNALTEAIERIAGDEAKSLLTPRFLEWDLVRPRYPVPETELRSKRGNGFLAAFSLRSTKDVHEETKRTSLLQVQLMQKWQWPVGIQILARHHESQEYRNAVLAGRAAWQPIELEVEKLLSQTRSLYPLVFE